MQWDILRQNAIRRARQDFRSYLGSFAFWRYVLRLSKKIAWTDLPSWRRRYKGYRGLRYFGNQLAQKGEILLGVVVMRNTSLSDPKMAAPALVLGSFHFSAAGMDELIAVASRFEAMRTGADDDAHRAVAAIMEDEEYRQFRRRPLPACVGAPDHMLLFDELMRGDDFFTLEYSGDSIPSPFIVLFANRNEPILASAVVPRGVAKPAIEYLMAERVLSAEANSSGELNAAELPPPLPQIPPDAR